MKFVVNGKAVLELAPPFWREACAAAVAPGSLAAAMLLSLWGAHDQNTAVAVAYDGTVRVDVAVPSDGSLDLHALQRDFQTRIARANVEYMWVNGLC
jgi:hypothetical protein